jgi:2-polyprenyl-6-methoxyphenol hydroxylase-like FAD-dependent oxidoreductase
MSNGSEVRSGRDSSVSRPTPIPGARRSAIVVGAGIAGLAAAHALDRLGFEVRVLERSGAPRDEGAGLTLWPNAVHALEALGLQRALEDRAHRLIGLSTLLPDGRPLTSLPLSAIEQRYGSMVAVDRGELLSGLLEELRVPTEYQAPVVAAAGRLLLGGSEIDADLIVGADGIHSVTRTVVAGEVEPRPAGYGAWRGVASTGDLTPLEASETLGAGRRFGLVPLTRERTYWYAAITGDEGHADLEAEFAGWHAPISEVLARTPAADRTFLPLADLPHLDRWYAGRTVLVGDAAHAMTPNLGQGAAQALEDVAVLARRLEGEAVEAALAGYAGERKRRGERIVARSRSAGRAAQASGPLAVRARNAVARRMPRAAVMRQLSWLLES